MKLCFSCTQFFKFCIKSGHLQWSPSKRVSSIGGKLFYSNLICNNDVAVVSFLWISSLISCLSTNRSMKWSILWGISWLGFDICVFWMTLDLSGDSFSDVDFAFFGLYGVNCRRIIISLSVNFFVEWTEFGWELLGWVTSLSLFSDGGKIFDGFFILVLMDGVSRRFFNISAILTFSFASLTISNACASSNSISFF